MSSATSVRLRSPIRAHALASCADELDGHAVMRSGFDAGTRRRDDAVIVAGRQVDPGPDLVRPCLDLGVIGLGPERQRGLAGGLGGLAVA